MNLSCVKVRSPNPVILEVPLILSHVILDNQSHLKEVYVNQIVLSIHHSQI